MFALVDQPYLNVAGTLLGDQGACIDTRIVVNGTGHVYIGPPEAREIARVAVEAGWLEMDKSRVEAALANANAELKQLRERLARISAEAVA